MKQPKTIMLPIRLDKQTEMQLVELAHNSKKSKAAVIRLLINQAGRHECMPQPPENHLQHREVPA